MFSEQQRGAAPQGQELGVSPSGPGRAWQAGPVPAPHQEQGTTGTWHLYGVRLGQGWADPWAGARQGCEELEPGPAVASMGQGLVALGSPWSLGLGRDRRGWQWVQALLDSTG